LLSSHTFDSYDKVKKASVKNCDIRLWNLCKKKWIKTLLKKEEKISSVLAFENYEKLKIITGAEDGIIKLWDETNNIVVKTLKYHKSKITEIIDIHLFKEGYIASCELLNGVVVIWDINQPESNILVTKMEGNPKGVNSLLYLSDYDAKLIACAGFDKKIYIFDLRINISVKEINAHDNEINCLKMVKNNNDYFIISGSSDTKCKVWNINDGFKLIATLEGHTKRVNSICVINKITSSNCLIATGGEDAMLIIWDLNKFVSIKEIRCNGEINKIIHADFISRNFVIYAEKVGIVINRLF